jgi:hypothetical protein
MSKAIWKFQVDPETPIPMPEGAVILSVGVQNDSVFVWAMVDPSSPSEIRYINGYATGASLPDDPGIFIGTVMLHGGRLVFHFFDAMIA